MRLVLLSAALSLVGIGVLTIYAIGNPAADQPTVDLRQVVAAREGVSLNELEQTSDTIYMEDEADEKEAGGGIHSESDVYKKQLVYVGAGLILLVLVNLFSYERLGPISYGIYAVILVLLAVLLVDKRIDLPFVDPVKGARRWIKIGFGFNIQPSEFCKIAFILALAWYLRFRSNYRKFWGLVGPFALTLLAMMLILLEPDLGTTLLLMPILFSMLFVAGAKVKHLVLILCMGIAVSPLLWGKMRPYQRMRISSVLLQNDKVMKAAKSNQRLAEIMVGDPDLIRTWERGRGYQLIQSKRAIASGGLSGYGFAKGPYVQYGYLPDRHNDFIFAMIAHQFGILGCATVLVLYIIMIACAIELAWLNTDPFGRLVAVGIAAMFAVQVLVNTCMTLGLMPITGLTLPLVSYGGSSMLVNLTAVGLLNNIGRHRPFSVAAKPFEFSE
jgi:rod shape determining protein RodA